MSEPRSLYVNVKISKDRLEKFFQDKPTPATVDENWASWWNSRKMYSPSPLTEIPVFSDETNRAIAEGFLSAIQMGTIEDITQEDRWIFSVLMFSENYFEILPTLAWIASLANHMEPGDTGFAVVYDYFWGGEDLMAHMELKDQQAVLKHTLGASQLDPDSLKAAQVSLGKAFDMMSSKFED